MSNFDDLSARIELENENKDIFIESPIPELSGVSLDSKNTFIRFTDSESLSGESNKKEQVSKFQTILTFVKKNILLCIICLVSFLIIGELIMASSKYKIENENLKQKIDLLTKEKVDIENKYSEVVSELEKNKTESQKQINELNSNIESIRALCKEARENIEVVNGQLAALKEEHQSALNKNADLSKTIEKLENDLSKMQPKQSFLRKLLPF